MVSIINLEYATHSRAVWTPAPTAIQVLPRVQDAAAALPSFAAVHADNARYVFRVLRRLGVAAKDVEDVCQDVFLVIHRKLHLFGGRSTVRTWVYGIALRCAADYRRRAHVMRETPAEIDDSAIEPSQPAALAQREARALLDTIIEGLDDDKRAVFVLYELEELAMADVAEAIGCPLQTAYSRLHAARAAVEAAAMRLRAREVKP